MAILDYRWVYPLCFILGVSRFEPHPALIRFGSKVHEGRIFAYPALAG